MPLRFSFPGATHCKSCVSCAAPAVITGCKGGKDAGKCDCPAGTYVAVDAKKGDAFGDVTYQCQACPAGQYSLAVGPHKTCHKCIDCMDALGWVNEIPGTSPSRVGCGGAQGPGVCTCPKGHYVVPSGAADGSLHTDKHGALLVKLLCKACPAGQFLAPVQTSDGLSAEIQSDENTAPTASHLDTRTCKKCVECGGLIGQSRVGCSGVGASHMGRCECHGGRYRDRSAGGAGPWPCRGCPAGKYRKRSAKEGADAACLQCTACGEGLWMAGCGAGAGVSWWGPGHCEPWCDPGQRIVASEGFSEVSGGGSGRRLGPAAKAAEATEMATMADHVCTGGEHLKPQDKGQLKSGQITSPCRPVFPPSCRWCRSTTSPAMPRTTRRARLRRGARSVPRAPPPPASASPATAQAAPSAASSCTTARPCPCRRAGGRST